MKESEGAAADVAIISYNEKLGIHAIGNTAPDLPPQPGTHETFARDHEYKRHGTLFVMGSGAKHDPRVDYCPGARFAARDITRRYPAEGITRRM